MPSLSVLMLAAGGVLVVTGVLIVRASGSWSSIARRLGAAREVRVGDLGAADRLPARPVRVVGRIRCADPLLGEKDDRLVAMHRDVDVRIPGGRWLAIERLRESRGFELWDHDGTATVDPARAAEPLVTIPHVWRGHPDLLTDARYRSAIERVAAEHGKPQEARAVTRLVSVVERLQVLAIPERDSSGSLILATPPGGYVISTLDLDAAMRLLAGSGRRRLLVGVGTIGAGSLALAIGLILAAISALGG